MPSNSIDYRPKTRPSSRSNRNSGIGKNTASKILAGKLKPNLGRYELSGGELQRFAIAMSSYTIGRHESLSFKMVETAKEVTGDKTRHYSYPAMTKTLGSFKPIYRTGLFSPIPRSLSCCGENGTEKTIFVRLLAGVDTPDIETDELTLSVSLKPQTITPKFSGTVRMLVSKADQGGVYAGYMYLFVEIMFVY
ncbi:hypothetical protein BT96DRAFT_947006 [Gymnopus androsaceus JB14]|uniref:Uncharacterized protein n=1 Tax=Gymnopus androsaceus JB14 TaxID=1447944 RepID=A0A6A4GV89_9AGAR|nr:hypothetical protein BT96DRAFT_947006 [Gymnopus androsaceus JB14]